MYRILIILSSIVLLATSCQKETSIDSPATLTYTVVPQVSFDVKSGGEGTTAVNSLSCHVYHYKNDSYEYIPEMSVFEDITDPNNIKVSVKLFKDQKYRLIFVAQHCIKSESRTISYTYNITNGIMRVNEAANITSGDQLEAFAYVDEVSPAAVEASKDIVLNRIVSQINIGTSTAVSSLPSSLKVEVSGTPESYDLVNNCCNDITELTFNNISVAGDKLTVSNTDYTRLTTLYFLGSNKIDLSLTSNTEDPETFTIENVDTKVNYKTNIVGNIQLGKVTAKAASLIEFKNAIANPQVTSIELTAPITISEDIEINGHGVIVKQPATWNHAESTPIITIQHANVTLKNIHFKDTYKAPLIDVVSNVDENGDYKDFILDNITVTGHNTAVGPMITLRGKAEITNCHFKDNVCAGNSLICFDAGTGGLIFKDNNLTNNTVQTSDTNAAIVYITHRPNCTIENNTITGNLPNNEIK